MSEMIGLEFETPEGETLGIEWDEGVLSELTDPAADAKPEWKLSGQIDWDEISLLRVLAAHFEDGRTLAVASVRPARAEGHGDEIPIGTVGTEDGLKPQREVLISTEYGGDGIPTRVGLELYPDEEERAPERVAGDVIGSAVEVDGAVKRIRAVLAVRLGGTPGVGVYEILQAA